MKEKPPVTMHKFLWKDGVGTCTCGLWELMGSKSEKVAKRDYMYHQRKHYETNENMDKPLLAK